MGGLGVDGESAGLDMPSREEGEAIVVKEAIQRERRLSYRIWEAMCSTSEQKPVTRRSVNAVESVVGGMDRGSRYGSGSLGSVSSPFRCTCRTHYVLAGANNTQSGSQPCSCRCAGMRLREPERARWGNVPAGAVGSRELRRGVGGGGERLRRRWSLGMEVAMQLERSVDVM